MVTPALPIRSVRLETIRTARCALLGPEDAAAVRELWVVLHGYGQLAAEFLGGFGAIADGARLLVAPEGLSRFYEERSAPARHRDARVGASWMTREDRLAEIEDQRRWLQLAYETQARVLGPDVPLTVLGFSQGAAAAARWVAGGGVTPRQLVLWGGALAPEIDIGLSSPLRRTRVRLVLGDRDRVVSEIEVRAERERLDAACLAYDFLTFPGGHRLDDATLRVIAGVGT